MAVTRLDKRRRRTRLGRGWRGGCLRAARALSYADDERRIYTSYKGVVAGVSAADTVGSWEVVVT